MPVLSKFTSSTLEAVLADVSIKISPCSRANASPSSFLTSRLDSKSLRWKKKKVKLHGLTCPYKDYPSQPCL